MFSYSIVEDYPLIIEPRHLKDSTLLHTYEGTPQLLLAMTQKRKLHPPGPHAAQSKRARFAGEDNDINGDAASKAQVDPTYGQRSAFPGLDETAGEEALFYGPASDGLEYLRMVR